MPRGRSAPRLPQGITQGLPRGSHRTPPRRAGCCPGCGPVRRGGMLSPTDTQPHRPRQPQPQPRRCRDALGGGHRQQVRPPGGRTGGGVGGLRPGREGAPRRFAATARPREGREGKSPPPLTRPSRLPSPRSRPHRRDASPWWRRRWWRWWRSSTPALPRGERRLPRSASAAAAPPCAGGSGCRRPARPGPPARGSEPLPRPGLPLPALSGRRPPPPFPSPAAGEARPEGRGSARLSRFPQNTPVPRGKPSTRACRRATVC